MSERPLTAAQRRAQREEKEEQALEDAVTSLLGFLERHDRFYLQGQKIAPGRILELSRIMEWHHDKVSTALRALTGSAKDKASGPDQ